MEDLSQKIFESGTSCHIEDLYNSHVFYADDLCLMAHYLHVHLQQEQINLCYE